MSTSPTVIFKATYSGVPVYEMPCKGVAVMRRRKDSWLNATQILKVAGFDKPQRTRVLEREVQKGTHEKIQGGYGKYQGTWVPADRGLSLAKAFGVDHLLAPLFDFQPNANASPPLAPKHITAPSVRGRGGKAAIAAARIHALAKQPDKHARASVDSASERSFSLAPIRDPNPNWPSQSHLARSTTLSRVKPNTHLPHPPSDNAPDIALPNRSVPTLPRQNRPSPTPSAISSSSTTPSPLEDLLGQGHPIEPYPHRNKGKAREISQLALEPDHARGQKRKYDHGPVEEAYSDGIESHCHDECPSSPMAAKYARLILDYFVSESSQIPDFLIHPPPDFDPNVVIDDDGHTALHWACAMGRMQIVDLLLACGADIFRANNAGQTALMRAVMFTNNYELGKFGELFELFSPSTINIDRNDRTVFHYVVDIALSKGKVQAARYYLETILERLALYPKELADILNFQDEDGESALTLAARCRSKRLVRILLDHGANPKTSNREGKSAEDYILEDDQFRMLEPEPAYLVEPESGGGEEYLSAGSLNGQLRIRALDGVEEPTPSALEHGTPPASPTTVEQVRCSETGRRIAREAGPQMLAMIEALGCSFDAELEEKERDSAQADGLLRSIEAELAEGARKIDGLKKVLGDFGEKKRLVGELEEELGEKMGKRYRFGWEKYFRDEEEREKKFVEERRGLVVQAGGGTEVGIEDLLVSSESEEASGPVGRLRALERENSDLVGLLEVPKEIEGECEGLRGSVRGLWEERASLFREFINLASENGQSEEGVGIEAGEGAIVGGVVGGVGVGVGGNGSRLNRYRRLVSLGCGGIGLEEVDEVIESFEDGIELSVEEALEGERRRSGESGGRSEEEQQRLRNGQLVGGGGGGRGGSVGGRNGVGIGIGIGMASGQARRRRGGQEGQSQMDDDYLGQDDDDDGQQQQEGGGAGGKRNGNGNGNQHGDHNGNEIEDKEGF